MAKTPFSANRFLWIFVAWWLSWAALHVWVIYSQGYPLEIALTDSLVSNGLLALACILVSNNLQYYLPRHAGVWYIPVFSLVLAAIWAFFSYKLMQSMRFSGQSDYSLFWRHSLPVRYSLAFLLIACTAVISVLWYTFEEQKETARRKAEAADLAKEAELYKLRTQLQPHFLFNSLNSINALVGSEPALARKMIQQLSEFLRGTLKRDEHQWVLLKEELQYLQLYLEIEKVRFGQRLATRVEASPEAMEARLPAMLMQPLVENAIKFGLYDTTGTIEIVIRCHMELDTLHISIQNPYDPETARPKQGTGFGLSSIERRLYLLFARNDLLSASGDGSLYTTRVKIPTP